MSAARIGMLILAALNLVVGAGLFFDAPWAAALWPWTDQPLDRVVLSSFLVAGAGTVAWIGLTAEWGALVGALLDVGLFHAGAALWFFERWRRGEIPEPHSFASAASASTALGTQAVVFGALLLVELGALRAVWGRPLQDNRPVDRLLIGSFAVFALVLLVTGAMLVTQQPIWPWPLNPASSALFGCLFLGSAVYFVYGLRRPNWGRMKGQLIAFLLYDLVLVQPYLHMGDGELGYQLNYASLAVYWAVILYSGGLSAYYLFFHPRLKGWGVPDAAP